MALVEIQKNRSPSQIFVPNCCLTLGYPSELIMRNLNLNFTMLVWQNANNGTRARQKQKLPNIDTI